MINGDPIEDENGVPCTCSEKRAVGDPELHAPDCLWALSRLAREEEDEDDLPL